MDESSLIYIHRLSITYSKFKSRILSLLLREPLPEWPLSLPISDHTKPCGSEVSDQIFSPSWLWPPSSHFHCHGVHSVVLIVHMLSLRFWDTTRVPAVVVLSDPNHHRQNIFIKQLPLGLDCSLGTFMMLYTFQKLPSKYIPLLTSRNKAPYHTIFFPTYT